MAQASPTGSTRPVKAVVLAAGHDLETRELLLRPLASSTVVEQTLATVVRVVPPDQVVVVSAEHDPRVRQLLGPGWNHVVQTVQAGTGDAVRCARHQLAGFDGDVLIVYADTPLIRSASLRGLLNRHRLKQAQFSLLTARTSHPGEYGRVERDAQGQISAIVEPSDPAASDPSPSFQNDPAAPDPSPFFQNDPAAADRSQVEATTADGGVGPGVSAVAAAVAGEPSPQAAEVNVGAYLIDNEVLISQLDAMARHGEHRLTELARRLMAQSCRPSSYTILDPDELQGINSADQLALAADVVLKRLFSPQHAVETAQISFGTGGWRARIGEGFTIHNVRRLSQAIANQVTRDGRERQGVVIGGDRRFLSKEAAESAAEVFAGNNINVFLLPEDVPTPLVTFAAPHLGAAYGLVFTASHNPPQWNGLKVFRHDGSLPLADQTDRYQDEANALSQAEVVAVDLGVARAAGLVREIDLTAAYIDAVEQTVDVQAMRARPGLKVAVDPMHGTSQLTLGMILSDARCHTTFIHTTHDPLFGGHSPAPDPERLQTLAKMMRDGGYDLGMATDGDSDRIAIVDQRGEHISTNDLLLLLYWYLHQVRGMTGGVVRNLATTHLLDRLAAHFGEPALEVPVGFKHITFGMAQIGALLGGESSGGLTIRGHILGKDGIFACALVVEMLARTGQSLSQLLAGVHAITGRLYALETGMPATPAMRVALPRRMALAAPAEVAGEGVVTVDGSDGVKFRLDSGAWALLRFSGTEPVLRLFAEAATPQRAQALIDWLSDFALSA
ncbi:MAG: NTP transferase domain-containing protein [Propionibacteriaceae bacterium]|nr:NTP transferase domain-containing protein [Propionibacteriaceae bacterium]